MQLEIKPAMLRLASAQRFNATGLYGAWWQPEYAYGFSSRAGGPVQGVI